LFSYFRYIAVVSFLIVLVAAFFAGVYFRTFAAHRVIQQPLEESYKNIATSFEKNVWCNYEPIIDQLQKVEVRKWASDPYYQRFEKLSRALLSIAPATKINLYTDKGVKFFSTNDMEIVFLDTDSDNTPAIKKSLNGDVLTKILPSLGLYNDKTEIKGSYVQGFFPILGKNCNITDKDKSLNKVKIVMEVFHNVTNSWDSLYLFQAMVTFGIIITFVILYLALFITSSKTEKIINKQHEEKLALEKAKTIAEAQNKEKSMFLANVSHELRTPLNAIIGFSEIIKDEVMGPVGHPQYKEYINDINTSGVHLLSLINDILDYSKAEARKLEVEEVDIDLSKIADGCLRLVEPRANEAKVKLVENIPDRHVLLKGDPKRMKQVILNLLSNAVKFTPESGQVTLSIHEEFLDEKVYLVVSDTGIGISQKDISKAMAPFGQIDSSLSRRYEGTGLGLPLTKKLTEIMGGVFDIKSEVGLGTTVTLIFPLNKKENRHNSADNNKF